MHKRDLEAIIDNCHDQVVWWMKQYEAAFYRYAGVPDLKGHRGPFMAAMTRAEMGETDAYISLNDYVEKQHQRNLRRIKYGRYRKPNESLDSVLGIT